MKSFIQRQVYVNSVSSLLSKGLNLLVALIGVLAVLSFFTEKQQGIYYFALSLISLGLASEAGLTMSTGVAITNHLGGISKNSLERFNKLVRYDDTMKAIINFALIVFFLIFLVFSLITSLMYFSAQEALRGTDASFYILICLIIFFSYLNLINQSILEGCGKVENYQRALIKANLLGLLFFGVLIYLKFYFYAVIFQYLVRALMLMFLLNREIPIRLVLGSKSNIGSIKSYVKGIGSFQFRIGVSWIAGAVMYYSIVPIIVLSGSIEVAGEIGLGFQLFHAILGLALSWQLGSQAAFVNMLIQKDRNIFLEFVQNVSTKCGVTALLLSGLVFLLLLFLDARLDISHRFGSFLSPLILCSAACLLAWVSPRTASIRANKEDPFVILSVAVSIVVASFTWTLASNGDAMHLPIGFFVIMFAQAIFINIIFNSWIRSKFGINKDL